MVEDSFFCIKYDNREDGFDAMLLVAEYDLKFSMTHNDDGTGVLVVYKDICDHCGCVECNGGGGNFRLAEMAFQMNYRQVDSVCPVCYKEGEDLCGHLTFNGRI